MKLNKLIKDLRFDKRIIEWGIRYNLITHEDYNKYQKSLEDLSDEKENMVDPQYMEQRGDQSEES